MFEKRKKEEKKSGRQDSKKGKKVKKRKEEYVELRGLLGVGKDYHVYHMTPADYLISWFGAVKILCTENMQRI